MPLDKNTHGTPKLEHILDVLIYIVGKCLAGVPAALV
jgi:hypothetical protein